MVAWSRTYSGAVPQFVTIGMDVHTMYDKDQKEIEDLMMRWLGLHARPLGRNLCLARHTNLLCNIFTMSAMKNYFETLQT